MIGEAVKADVAKGHSISVPERLRRLAVGNRCRFPRWEPRLIRDMVEVLAPSRAGHASRPRFAEARRKLEEAGLLERLQHCETVSDDDPRSRGPRLLRPGDSLPVPRRGVVLDLAEERLRVRLPQNTFGHFARGE